MKQNGFIRVAVVFWVFFPLVLGGCFSVPNSPSPRFFSLQPIEKNQAAESFTLPPGVIIAFGPVKIPEYLNRPQIVTKNKDKTLKFSQFNRWGQPLDRALTYTISEDLSVMFSGATIYTHPWNSTTPVRYQVIMDVAQLESELDNEMVFTAQWSVVDLQNNAMLLAKRSEYRQSISPHNYFGLVEALNKACASLSNEIAQGMVNLGKDNLLPGEKR